MKVFIADDSPVVHGQVTVALSQVKGTVIVGRAYDGVEASRAIPKVKPDVVILDLQLPGRDGLEVLQTIKHHTQPPPAVILFTQHGQSQTRRKCMEVGADFCLDKTTEMEKMASIAREMLTERQEAA